MQPQGGKKSDLIILTANKKAEQVISANTFLRQTLQEKARLIFCNK